LFALFHGPTNIMSFVIYGGSSVILTLLAYRTRRLEASIAVHTLQADLKEGRKDRETILEELKLLFKISLKSQ
ncbi:CPBP family intramembrane metalloprotease, partial [Streptococcus gordonii]